MRKNRLIGHFGLLGFCTCLVLASAPLSHADYIEPGDVKIATVHYTPNQLIFRPGKYEYSVRWEGIPVASAEVTLGEAPQLIKTSLAPGNLTIRATTKTARVIDLLYKLRHTSESVFDGQNLRPLKFISEQTENSKYKRWEINFQKDSKIVSKLYRSPGESEPDPEDSRDFESNNLTVDPLFGAILARSIPVSVGQSASFDIWNGKHRYLITFTVEGQEEIKVGGQTFLADKIEPQVQKLTDSDGEKRLRSCTIWIAADASREILKIESKVLFGSVTASLESVTPITEPAAPPAVIEAQKPTEEDLVHARASLRNSSNE